MFLTTVLKLTNNMNYSSEKRLYYNSFIVTSEDVLAVGDNYFCQCNAWYRIDEGWQQKSGNRGFISVVETMEPEQPKPCKCLNS